MTNTVNEALKKISEVVYADRAEIRMVDVSELKLLPKNARYMIAQTYGALSKNIKTDGFLSSVPLCVEEEGKLLVLSGNHRVKASRDVGLKNILVIVDKRQMTEGHKKAIALSHNSLVGQDDAEILKSMWMEIELLADKEYTGLDSKTVDNLLKTAGTAFNSVRIPTKQLVFWFIPQDLEYAERVIEDAGLIKGDSNHVADIKSYQKMVDLIIKIKKEKNIKNSALALQRILELAEEQMKGGMIEENQVKPQDNQDNM
jgi:hypothetical protein